MGLLQQLTSCLTAGRVKCIVVLNARKGMLTHLDKDKRYASIIFIRCRNNPHAIKSSNIAQARLYQLTK